MQIANLIFFSSYYFLVVYLNLKARQTLVGSVIGINLNHIENDKMDPRIKCEDERLFSRLVKH